MQERTFQVTPTKVKMNNQKVAFNVLIAKSDQIPKNVVDIVAVNVATIIK